MTKIKGLEHLNCIKVGEVPKLIAIPIELPVINFLAEGAENEV